MNSGQTKRHNANDIMQKNMKEKVKQEYLRKEKLVVRLRLYGGNFIRAIHAWAIGVARHSTSARN